MKGHNHMKILIVASSIIVIAFTLISTNFSFTNICPRVFVHSIITGQIINVLDGDTVKIIANNKPWTIRIFGIDAPETMQRYGHTATLYARSVLLNKSVSVQISGGDRYGRLIGDILFADGGRFSNFMVASGSAWWYRQYAGNDKILRDLEKKAKENKIGLWADDHPIAPWVWRHMRNRPIARSL
jgi:endonuclease YncB( thermonuclease family)